MGSKVLIAQDKISPILILQSSEDEFSLEVSTEITEIFKYPEFPFKIVDLAKVKSIPITDATRLVINTTTDITSIDENELERIVEYLGAGGNLIFMGTITDERFAFLQGISPVADYTIDQTVRGVKGVNNIFPGFQDQKFYSPRNVPHGGLKVDNFISSIRILATAVTDEEYPLVIENDIGLGTVLVLNTYVLYEKDYRGLIFSTIVKMLPNLPYRVANVGTIFLDDFPAPLYNTMLEPIASEYNVDQAEFVANIWWPEMKKLADSLLITYSAMTAFNYNANIVPPFDYDEWNAGIIKKGNRNIKGSIYLAQDIIKTRHELAFHGYNHFSLVSEEWDNNPSFMESALNSVKKRWRVDDLGKLPVTYVPPTNYIDSIGIKAVTKALPSLKIMSSLYLGDKESGGGRGFGPDPYSSNLFNYPRITSGMNMDGNSIFNQHSMQLATGIWNHFIHPDDVFQIVQRDVDEFESRNPDNLGWRTSADTSTSLYKEFVKRLNYTKKQYPFLRFVSAEEGVMITKDWLATNTSYLEDLENYEVNISPPAKYVSVNKNKEDKYWFMYVLEDEKAALERYLSNNLDGGYTFVKYWNGYLFQFYSKSNSIKIPKPKNLIRPKTIVDNSVRAVKLKNNGYLTNPFFIGLASNVDEVSAEQQLNNALNSYRRNPNSKKAQEDVITLSIENDNTTKAIEVLEYRLSSDTTWNENDVDRLITYYGYESAYDEAENFLEKLWYANPSGKIFRFKDKIVASLGLYSQAFVTRWALRDLKFYGSNIDRTIAYTSSIENEETWTEIKPRLLSLIEANPRNDSLYAYVIQRSFFYETPDSTIALLEDFPAWSHDQLSPFATQFANIYGYDILNYDKALYWAEISEDIPNRAKLEWIVQKNEIDRFYDTSIQFLENSPDDDSLRVFAGTTLYYLGFIEKGREIIYPLFGMGKNNDTQAHRLIEDEFEFMSYNDKKNLFLKYPNFFNEADRKVLRTDLRWNEGMILSVFGEYFSDNFDNYSARGGVSTQFGNRRNKSHLFKLEDIYVNNSIGNQNFYSNFTGIGYEYEKRKEDFSRVLRFGPSLFFGSEGILGEAFVSYSISYDSTFTALNLSFEPEVTRQSILQDIYKVKAEFYREDPWLNNKFLTTLSGNTQFYSNKVLDYSLTGRAYLQPWETSFRGRLIGELGWQDATKDFPGADPFFTQNNYFLQGGGFDLRYRLPNSFDYKSLFELELMAKHAATDGFFITGRVNIEHKFDNFWQIKVGTDFSTSTVYQSNRIFFTISHFFNKKLRGSKQK